MLDLKITRLNIFPIKNSTGKLKAFARVVLNDALQLTNMRIYDGANGLFVSFPIEFTKKGEDFRQMFSPTNKEFRTYLEDEILAEYDEVIKKGRNELQNH